MGWGLGRDGDWDGDRDGDRDGDQDGDQDRDGPFLAMTGAHLSFHVSICFSNRLSICYSI